MKMHKTVIVKMLGTMVDEWGLEEVADGLRKLAAERGVGLFDSRPGVKILGARKRSKLNAMQQIDRAQVPPEKRAILVVLAKRFDQKSFLPSLADIREFLTMSGQSPPAIKDRSDAFRSLLRFLQELPIERLNEIASSESHSGPSRLGPLSEAIAAAGGRIQRQSIFEEIGH